MVLTSAVWAVRSGHTVTIVSGDDHLHARTSKHYSGHALDLHASADLPGLNRWLLHHGYVTLFQVPNHWQHIHAQMRESLQPTPVGAFQPGRIADLAALGGDARTPMARTQ